jgi:hypothetical protein
VAASAVHARRVLAASDSPFASGRRRASGGVAP